jgi:hypothetical protein
MDITYQPEYDISSVGDTHPIKRGNVRVSVSAFEVYKRLLRLNILSHLSPLPFLTDRTVPLQILLCNMDNNSWKSYLQLDFTPHNRVTTNTVDGILLVSVFCLRNWPTHQHTGTDCSPRSFHPHSNLLLHGGSINHGTQPVCTFISRAHYLTRSSGPR